MIRIERRTFMTGILGTVALTLTQGRFATTVMAEALARSLATDPRRPQFHFLPAANWMNDPNGPVYFQGKYHMFYQYNPNGAFWGSMHWGHASSADMVHWKHLPVALAPTPGGPDADGCFSGTAMIKDGQVLLLYTAVRAVPEAQATVKEGAHSYLETQCLATANDPELRSFTKLPAPVIAAPPPGLAVTGFRDPSPWRHGDWWYMVIGSGIEGKGGAVLLYRSKDLRSWEFLHILAQREGSMALLTENQAQREVWECPELFALGDKHVLIYSTSGRPYWMAGALDPRTMQFLPETTGVLDYGSYYAPKTQLDKAGNRILWGWIPETRKQEEFKAAGWAGMMSLPRLLSMGDDGQLRIAVAAEVERLRKQEQQLRFTADEERNQNQITSLRVEASCGEILCVARRTAEPFQLALFDAAEPQTSTNACITLKYDPQHADQVWIDGKALPLHLGDREALELHLYVDGSVIEVFVNQRLACTKRFYVAGSSSRDLRLQWTGKTTAIERLSLWQLTPVSSDRLTT
jgi:beta-fructofuranosidase